MFFKYPIEVKREIVVNLLGNREYGRGRFIEDHFGVCHSELWEVRRRVEQALEAGKGGRPVTSGVAPPAYDCLGCIEKEARIDAIIADTEARVRVGRRRLAGCPRSGPAQRAPRRPAELHGVHLPSGRGSGRETIRTQIQQACKRADEIHGTIPWAEFIDRLAADELFAAMTPILVCVEPRSMAVPLGVPTKWVDAALIGRPRPGSRS